MPGESSSREPWGALPLVVDTSAWSRAHHESVREAWKRALLDDQLRVSPAVRLEILLSVRDGDSFDTLAEGLSALRTAPLTAAVIRAAQSSMRALAHRSAGAQRIPIVDYLVAAAAQETGAAVLHYDHDYDTLAEVMDFESAWLAPPGSLPGRHATRIVPDATLGGALRALRRDINARLGQFSEEEAVPVHEDVVATLDRATAAAGKPALKPMRGSPAPSSGRGASGSRARHSMWSSW